MKKLTEKETRNVNAWGGYTDMTFQHMEVEPSDVGNTRGNYLGYHHATHKFTEGDVGRVISLMRDPADPTYICWSFAAI